MFTILLRTAHGWTDDLGQHEPDANSWSTHDDAVAAIASLQAVGIGCSADAFRIVPIEHLDRYKLVS